MLNTINVMSLHMPSLDVTGLVSFPNTEAGNSKAEALFIQWLGGDIDKAEAALEHGSGWIDDVNFVIIKCST